MRGRSEGAGRDRLAREAQRGVGGAHRCQRARGQLFELCRLRGQLAHARHAHGQLVLGLLQLHLALEASLQLRQEGVLDLRRDGHLSFDVLQLIPQPHHLRGRLGHRRGPFGEAEHGSGNRGGPNITRRG